MSDQTKYIEDAERCPFCCSDTDEKVRHAKQWCCGSYPYAGGIAIGPSCNTIASLKKENELLSTSETNLATCIVEEKLEFSTNILMRDYCKRTGRDDVFKGDTISTFHDDYVRYLENVARNHITIETNQPTGEL